MRYTLVLLDRDGVVNADSADYIKTPEQWHPLPGALEAIRALNRAGVKVAICTNQSGIGRGLYSESTLHAIHRKMIAHLIRVDARVDGIYYCPHTPDAGCDCRKPRPGLLLRAMSELSEPAATACFIGDSARDLDAAAAAGCTPILVQTGNGAALAQTLSEGGAEATRPAAICSDLATAVQILLAGAA